MAKTIPTRALASATSKNTEKKPGRQNGRGRIAKTAVAATAPAAPPLDDSELYMNRELSLLEFQRRVLEEADDETVPLLERVKFLSIVGSNLDEFFMVRVAGLKRQVERRVLECGPDGMTAAAQLAAIRERVAVLFQAAHECWQGQILPLLGEAGIHILDYPQLSSTQRSSLNKYFHETIFRPLRLLPLIRAGPFLTSRT